MSTQKISDLLKEGESYEEIKCAVNDQDVKEHLNFLKKIYEETDLHQPHVINNAIRRYEQIWLPVVVKIQTKIANKMIPPLDVEWVWHCHRLAPEAYFTDCIKIAGKLVESFDTDTTCVQDSKREWMKHCNDEPYDIDCSQIELESNYQPKSTYDLVAACQRQSEFYYNVSLPHYKDSSFINNAIQRYRMFMNLRRLHPKQFLVPMYDIDLVWHTHQRFPLAYREDTETYFGHVLHHDDTTTDRSEGSQRNEDEKITKKFWSDIYKTTLAFPGTMYRGQSPKGHLTDIDESICDNDGHILWKCLLRIDSLHLKCNDKIGKRLGLNFFFKENDVIIHQDVKMEVQIQEQNTTYVWDSRTVDNSFPFSYYTDTNKKYTAKFTIYKRTGVIPFITSKKEIQTFAMDMTDVIDKQFRLKKASGAVETEFSVDSTLADGMIFTINCTMGKISQEAYSFSLETPFRSNTFETHHISDVDLGSVPLHHLSSVDMKQHPYLRIAELRATVTSDTKNDKPILTTKIIHSLPLRMSAIQVLQKNKITAVSHLIGLDQLPKKPYIPYLSPNLGQRAMLIKSNAGDWGIIFGRWDGIQPATRKNTITQPGYLLLNFYDLKNNKQTSTKLTLSSQTAVKLGQMTLTLSQKSGNIQLEKDCKDIAENIALALSILTLFVLCEPRSEVKAESLKNHYNKTNGYKPVKGKKHKSNYYYSKAEPWDYYYILWCGYDEETCSNSHLYVAAKERANTIKEENENATTPTDEITPNSIDNDSGSYWTNPEMTDAYDPCSRSWDDIVESAMQPSTFTIESDSTVATSTSTATSGSSSETTDTGFCPWSADVADTSTSYSSSGGGGGSSSDYSSGYSSSSSSGYSSGYSSSDHGSSSGGSSCATSSSGGGGSSCHTSHTTSYTSSSYSSGGGGSSCGSSCGSSSGGGGGGSSCGSSCGSSD